MTNNIWLEVSRSNGAILCYYLEEPTTASDKVDYIPATNDELTYLSALEDLIFAPGTIATLSDLTEHRTRLQAAKATSPAKPAAKASQQPSKAAGQPVSTNPKTTNPDAKERLIAALKQHRSHK
jgi:hypothetical protein